MEIDIPYLVAMFGVVFGVLWRTIIPFLKAKAEAEKAGEVVKFEVKFLYSAIISLVVTIMTVLLAMESFILPEGSGGLIALFMAGFVYGMVFHSASNKVVELMLA